MKEKSIYAVLLAVMLIFVAGCTPGTGFQINTPVPKPASGTPTSEGQIKVPGFNIQLNAPGANPLADTADSNGRVAGILTGVWHGIISPVTLIMSFINSNVQMYEVYNDGSQYDLGFLVGVAIIFLVLGLFAGRRRRI